MKSLTIESGIQVEKYDSIVAEIDNYTSEELKDCYEWLKDTFHKQYHEVHKIKSLQPQHLWDRYSMFGADGFREISLLKKAQKQLRIHWNAPYRTEQQKQRLKNKKAAVKHKNIRNEHATKERVEQENNSI